MQELSTLRHFRAETDRRRWLLGLAVTQDCRRLESALVAFEGQGLDCRPQPAAVHTVDVPRDIRALFLRLTRGRHRHAAEIGVLATRLAELQASVVAEMAAVASRVWDRVLVVGVVDPGLWHRAPDGLLGYQSICDGAAVAELCGLSVIDAFPARDVAQNGDGQWTTALPLWLMLRHPRHTRASVSLGEVVQLLYLPAGDGAILSERILAWQFSCRATMCSLIAEGQFSGRAARRTEAHASIADAIVKSLERLPGSFPAPKQLLFAGEEFRNSALRAACVERMPGITLIEHAEHAISEGLLAAAAASLALLHIDQTPANLPHLSGARAPRVLGRIHCGSPHRWQRLVREWAQQKPAVVTLRAAI